MQKTLKVILGFRQYFKTGFCFVQEQVSWSLSLVLFIKTCYSSWSFQKPEGIRLLLDFYWKFNAFLGLLWVLRDKLSKSGDQ